MFRILFFAGILIFLALYDLKNGIIPNKVVYPAMAIAFVSSLASPVMSAVAALVCGAVSACVLLVPALFSKGMGMGDVKLAFLIGLMTGFPGSIFALIIGIFLGGLAAIVLISLRVKGRKDEMPYAPFLAMGALIALMSGRFLMGLLPK